jgi:hypothetical protein
VVEQPIRNRQVAGSSPALGSSFHRVQSGEILKGKIRTLNRYPFLRPLNLIFFLSTS